MKILVIGGTGPSGLYLVQGLVDRGHAVTVLHRGVHEPPDLAIVPHIHADPHFAEPLSEALGDRDFDVVYCLYGRLEVLARFFARRCERLIAVGGRAVYAGNFDPLSAYPTGMRLMASEDSPLAEPDNIHSDRVRRFVAKSLEAESAVMSMHHDGAYRATLFRYSYIYGPRSPTKVEWSIIKRLHDGRTSINLPSGGLVSYSRCAARNAAHYLTLALDSEAAQGQIFNCADEAQYSQGQWVELIAGCMGGRMEIVDVPAALRWTVAHFLLWSGTAADISLQDISKAKALLGYKDQVSPMDALAETVEWYRNNPFDWRSDPTFPDKFDYALEDRVREALDTLRLDFDGQRPKLESVHPYPHPKKPSLQTDEKGR